MTKQEYREYLKSEHWRKKKVQYLTKHKSVKRARKKFGKYVCMNLNCRSSENLNIHHLSYKRLGKEYLSDLIILCRKCHQKIHEKQWKNNQSIHRCTYDFLTISWRKRKKKFKYK